MPQVARTTNDLIINALYLTGELGVGESPDSFMLSTGIELINELLDKFSADSIYIPFLTTLRHTFVVNQATYSISDMVTADITADRVVDLSFANYTVPGNGFVNVPAPITFPFTANSVTSLLTFADTSSFPSGTPVTLSTTGIVPSPLVAGTTYYVINISATTIRLAATLADAMAGTPYIAILTNGTPTNFITYYNAIIQTGPENIVYPLRIINKATYYNIVRLDNLDARPGFIFLDKQPTESFITVYPPPDQPYPFSIQVKAMINSLAPFQDISELPPYYYGFMKYALARKFIAYYPSANWPQTNEDEYQEYFTNLKNANETDLTIRPSVTLTAPEPFYWPNILAY